MAPRNNEPDGSFQKISCSNDRDMDMETTLPCLMHKKHKVVKLVKSQLLKIQQEGLLNEIGRTESFLPEAEVFARADFGAVGPSQRSRTPRMAEPSPGEFPGTTRSDRVKIPFLCYLLALLIAILMLILLIVWISAGPLSNSMAHTPISPTAFVRTDSICSLEKKYLLRWSKPAYVE